MHRQTDRHIAQTDRGEGQPNWNIQEREMSLKKKKKKKEDKLLSSSW